MSGLIFNVFYIKYRLTFVYFPLNNIETLSDFKSLELLNNQYMRQDILGNKLSYILWFNTQEGTNVVVAALTVVVDVTSVHIYVASVATIVLARTPEVETINQRATIRKS